jgi:transcription initiation factor TFIID subunit 2
MVFQRKPKAHICVIVELTKRYYKEISKPRDLGTIMKKVEGKEGRKYQTMQQLADDIELVFSKYVPFFVAWLKLTGSCRQFNGPGEISALADATEATFKREWPKAVDPRMTPEERKAMQALLSRALKEPMSLIFREAVNPVELGIPTYFDV